MKLLIDSQVLIWLLYSPEKIGTQAHESIENVGEVYLSIISLWELTIKFGKQKLPYSPTELSNGADALNLIRMSLQENHILQLPTIQTPHGDPFDRMLLAQAETEGCHLLTSDKELLSTKYKTLPITS